MRLLSLTIGDRVSLEMSGNGLFPAIASDRWASTGGSEEGLLSFTIGDRVSLEMSGNGLPAIAGDRWALTGGSMTELLSLAISGWGRVGVAGEVFFPLTPGTLVSAGEA